MKIFSFIENIRPVNSRDAGSIREIHEAAKGLLRGAITETDSTEDVVEVRGRAGRQKIVIRESNTPDFIDILPPGIEVQVPIIGGIGGLGAVFLHFPPDFDSLKTDEDIIKSVAKPSRILKGHKMEPIRRKTLMGIGNLMRRVLNSRLKHEGMADSGAICIRTDLDPNDMVVEI